MPVPKRYFHVSQELNHDPEIWAFTDKFGDRALRTWLQILAFLDRSENRWRMTEDSVKNLSRMVRQYPKTVTSQIEEMLKNGWLEILEGSKNEGRMILGARNWTKYNRRQEHKGNGSVPDTETQRDQIDTPSVPTPTPFRSVPTPEDKKEEDKNNLPKRAVSVVPTERHSKSARSWHAYASAYQMRYQAEPVRNAQVNSLLCQLVDKLGTDKAPLVAAFYVQHNNPFYVNKRHPVNLLLADAEGLHTQWITGVKATTGEAKNAERRDDAMAQIQRIEAMRGGR